MGKSVRLGSCILGLNFESGQTNDFKIGIRSFSAGRSALKGQCEEQARKFTCCAVGKGTVVYKWPATPERACIAH